jgi:hypothetical protein
MAAKDPVARRRAASIAANTQWAQEPNRRERLANAHAKSPITFTYWRTWAAETHPDLSAADQIKAATNAHRAWQQQQAAKRSAKAKAARDAKARDTAA